MKWLTWRMSIVTAVMLGVAAAVLVAERPAAVAQQPKKKKKEKEADPPPRPTDPKLIELHKEFLGKAQKLAEDYERKKQHDKAREVYEAILRLVPNLPQAEEALTKIREAEATTDKKQITISASKGWQDTGVVLQEGKPVIIEAKGAWTFKMSHQLNPDGIEIPKELRNFNLGALIGVIVSGPDPKEFKPFHVGEKKEFTAERTGRLMLRMYDTDPTDNVGQLSVQVQSTFVGGKTKSAASRIAGCTSTRGQRDPQLGSRCSSTPRQNAGTASQAAR